MANDKKKQFNEASREDHSFDQAAASEKDAALRVALPALGTNRQDADTTGSASAVSKLDSEQEKPTEDPDATVVMRPTVTGGNVAVRQEEPFEDMPEETPDLIEVVARDERSTTQPSVGSSSVKRALSQRPPRRAKALRGPRTEMLESIIPEVIIPTDALSTCSMGRISVVEASALEQLHEIAREQGIEAVEEDQQTFEAVSDRDSSIQTAGQPEEACKASRENPHLRKVAAKRASLRDKPHRRGKKQRSTASVVLRIAFGVLALILVTSAVLGGLFAWDRWYRYDDANDIMGEWKMTNAERTVVITDKTIKIADGIDYTYELDTKEKTITYSFGGDSMTATYRFSPDRKTLIIDENNETDWLVAAHLKEDTVLADRDVPKGVSKLAKISNDTEAVPQNTEEVYEDTGDGWSYGSYVEGYVDIKRPKINKAGEDDFDNSEDKKSEDEEGPGEYSDGAAYVDETTGQRYYYDPNYVLYYDTAGNYYYDMYGNNPYYF